MAETTSIHYGRRVYPLDARQLTEEQIAVAFAMTSRRPEPFDEIAEQVSQEKAADFHERWVLGYGHASVAEHAVLHLAVENISRLACDTLEDNRLASYTEKSSRYQLMPPDYFHLPQELDQDEALKGVFLEACQGLFRNYQGMVDSSMEYLRGQHKQGEKERETAYNLRLRREATDSCRALLPAATLTNVGVTANARVLEYAISKLMSAVLVEERDLGEGIREQARTVTPTLVKYADRNGHLESAHRVRRHAAFSGSDSDPKPEPETGRGTAASSVRLVSWDQQAEERLTAALVYRQSGSSYEEVWRRVLDWEPEQRRKIISKSVAEMGEHDAPVREFEQVDYTFEFVLDYGAYREFKRHRMQSYLPQPLSTTLGYQIPELLVDAGLESRFHEALAPAEAAYDQVAQRWPQVAEYLVTHAHYRRVLTKMNLRECYHLFKLRTSEMAHFAIREPILEAMKQAVEVHPELFRYLRLRDYPAWWPFPLDAV